MLIAYTVFSLLPPQGLSNIALVTEFLGSGFTQIGVPQCHEAAIVAFSAIPFWGKFVFIQLYFYSRIFFMGLVLPTYLFVTGSQPFSSQPTSFGPQILEAISYAVAVRGYDSMDAAILTIFLNHRFGLQVYLFVIICAFGNALVLWLFFMLFWFHYAHDTQYTSGVGGWVVGSLLRSTLAVVCIFFWASFLFPGGFCISGLAFQLLSVLSIFIVVWPIVCLFFCVCRVVFFLYRAWSMGVRHKPPNTF